MGARCVTTDKQNPGRSTRTIENGFWSYRHKFRLASVITIRFGQQVRELVDNGMLAVSIARKCRSSALLRTTSDQWSRRIAREAPRFQDRNRGTNTGPIARSGPGDARLS